MPRFLESKLKKEYGKDSSIPYKVMNKLGYMKGSKETAKGKALDKKKGLAKKIKAKKPSFIDRLEAHKAEGASFDNGTWKPKHKGQSFEDALDEHKGNRDFD